MFATAPSGSTKPTPEETVRLRPGDLPTRLIPRAPAPVEPMTTRLKARSNFDSNTVRLRPLVDVPVVGKVTNTIRQRYLDLSNAEVKPPSTNAENSAIVFTVFSPEWSHPAPFVLMTR